MYENFQIIVKGISFIGQVGFMIITPPLCLGVLASFLMKRFGIGIWLMLLFLTIGILTSIATVWDFFKAEQKRIEKEAEKHKVITYNNHL
ncbi:MAG: AtpZ/AtpI family protein [Clostridia bacterium]|nr:AtpZ/AtpI family protein [Clostridia bacterium]